jgi:hypothetical protein
VVRWLRRNYPANKRVTVRLVSQAKAKDYQGICIYDDSSVLIRIREGQHYDAAVETLIEEWSHALRSECPIPCTDEHDALFWAIYSVIIKHRRGE